MRNPHIHNEGTASHEDAPKLRAVEVPGAKTVAEAMSKAQGTPAGKAALEWVRDNPKEAREMLEGEMTGKDKSPSQSGLVFFFPGTDDGKKVAVWPKYAGKWWRGFLSRTDSWNDACRIVVVD